MADAGIIGAGAWGTALAQLAARGDRRAVLWARDPDHAREMRQSGENVRRLPGIKLAEGILPTSDLSHLAACRLIVLAVPTQVLRANLTLLAPVLPETAPVVICVKGIERETGHFPSQIVQEILPANPVAVVSGPSFARDVAMGLPTAVTLASRAGLSNAHVQAVLGAPWFRLYQSTDVLGVELGGAGKNVIAIACGIAAGRALGASAGAALVARGFAELSRLGRNIGARSGTLMGLSGLGDLVLTCNSPQSRNYAFGFALGAGTKMAVSGIVEGAYTASVLARIAREREVDMPIVEAVDAVLAGRLEIDRAIGGLLERPSRGEAE